MENWRTSQAAQMGRDAASSRRPFEPFAGVYFRELCIKWMFGQLCGHCLITAVSLPER